MSTIHEEFYPGMSIDEIQKSNPYVRPHYLKDGSNLSEGRIEDINDLFDGREVAEEEVIDRKNREIRYRLDGRNLNKLNKYIPESIHFNLLKIKNKTYQSEEEFLKDVENICGDNDVASYKKAILKESTKKSENRGRYAAFRSIVHGYAIHKKGLGLIITDKGRRELLANTKESPEREESKKQEFIVPTIDEIDEVHFQSFGFKTVSFNEVFEKLEFIFQSSGRFLDTDWRKKVEDRINDTQNGGVMKNFVIDKTKKTFGRKFDMSNIFDYFSLNGYVFSKEIITRYFLSIKTKPFVILTGISGTGKTKIAQLFADYMCQNLNKNEKNTHIAFVPVRPDWMDNRGILGFYNLITNRYVTETILRLLIRAGNDPSNPYFIILDEMNIAKVEYYFSDFLSLMESRTHDRPEGEPLILHNQDDAVEASDKIGHIPKELYIPPNVFFTGTVNVDETTYMFSPKVLDRANVIEFNEVNLSRNSGHSNSKKAFMLKNGRVIDKFYNIDDSFKFIQKKSYDSFLSIVGDRDNFLLELFKILESYNLHFGYRVANEIAQFVCHAAEEIRDFELNDVLDIQFLQKVLPKFHGTRGKLEKPLMDIFKFCCDIDGEVNINIDLDSKDLIDGSRFPRTAKKVVRMIKDLQSQGYTSFIS